MHPPAPGVGVGGVGGGEAPMPSCHQLSFMSVLTPEFPQTICLLAADEPKPTEPGVAMARGSVYTSTPPAGPPPDDDDDPPPPPPPPVEEDSDEAL